LASEPIVIDSESELLSESDPVTDNDDDSVVLVSTHFI
jgi:hypothetical protein